MKQKTLKYQLTGVAPLLMHNARLSDPLDEFSKEMKKIHSKMKKTEADYEELARLEFLGGLYTEKDHPVITGEMVEGMLVESAKKVREGKLFRAAVYSEGCFPLEYEGPKTSDELWKNERFQLRRSVGIKGNRVIRTRPMFSDWHVDITVVYVHGEVEPGKIDLALERASNLIGLGDWRPKYGRFSVRKLN